MKKTEERNLKLSLLIPLEVLIFFGLVIGSVYCFTWLATQVISTEIFMYDMVVMDVIYSWRSPATTLLMNIITLLGKEGAIVITIGLVLLLYRHHKKWYAIATMLIVASNSVLNMLLKLYFSRPRPTEALVLEKFYSFPSGHTMTAFAVFSLVMYFTYRFVHKQLYQSLIYTISIVGIIAVGVSRIYLGAHFPSDVLAGFIASFWWLILLLFIRRTLKWI